MQLKQRGFTLTETLVALAVSAALVLSSMRLFPALQRSIWREYQSVSGHESVWLLAQRIGKHLRRAGYCRGDCLVAGLQLDPGGSQILIQWQSTSSLPGIRPEYERVGYRLHRGTLQILRGDRAFTIERWESLSDPSQTELTHFSVTREPAQGGPPRLIIQITGRHRQSQVWIRLRHIVRGENL